MTLNPANSSLVGPQVDPVTQAPTSSEVSTPARPRNLRFTGILTAEKINTLRTRFGPLIVCPGFVGQFGRKSDDWGRIYIPGAMDANSEAKRVWTRWEKKASKELYSWWPEAMKERGIKPITCNDILDGVTLISWKEYRKAYIRCRDARLQRRRRERLRNEANERAEDDDDPADAASSLLKLGGAGSKS